MIYTPNPPTLHLELTYNNLRRFFTAGFIIQCLLFFIPYFEIKKYGDSTYMSAIGLSRYAADHDSIGLAFYMAFLFCLSASFAILSITNPNRWVYTSGALATLLVLIVGIFTGGSSQSDVTKLYIPRIIDDIATIGMLSGFWIHPPEASSNISSEVE